MIFFFSSCTIGNVSFHLHCLPSLSPSVPLSFSIFCLSHWAGGGRAPARTAARTLLLPPLLDAQMSAALDQQHNPDNIKHSRATLLSLSVFFFLGQQDVQGFFCFVSLIFYSSKKKIDFFICFLRYFLSGARKAPSQPVDPLFVMLRTSTWHHLIQLNTITLDSRIILLFLPSSCWQALLVLCERGSQEPSLNPGHD